MPHNGANQTTSSDVFDDLLERVPIPAWAPVQLAHDAERLLDVGSAVTEQFRRPGIGEMIRPGMRVAVTAGSRGIDRMDQVLAAVVAEVRRREGEPFIVPAMGSHGGAVASGQVALLAGYGITEATMGCPIRASMDVVELGRLPTGERLYTDRIAYSESDLIIPVNRVKPHTDFQGTVESGLCKMIAIGLGKQEGASALHSSGFADFARLIPAAARFLIDHLPIAFGIAVVENGHAELARLEAIPAALIEQREAEVLQDARRRMARLPVEHLDVLVIDRIGKEISGSGMDPNVLGRLYHEKLPGGPDIQRIVVLDLTDTTEGNATGVGMADVCTERLAGKIDRGKTYMNVLTAKTPEGGRLPLIAPNDRTAIRMALFSLCRAPHDAIRLMRIRDTKNLAHVWASEALLPELLTTGRAQQLGEPEAPRFDSNGDL